MLGRERNPRTIRAGTAVVLAMLLVPWTLAACTPASAPPPPPPPPPPRGGAAPTPGGGVAPPGGGGGRRGRPPGSRCAGGARDRPDQDQLHGARRDLHAALRRRDRGDLPQARPGRRAAPGRHRRPHGAGAGRR